MPPDHDPPTALVAAAATALRDMDPGQSVNIGYEPSDAGSDAWIVMLDFADGSQTGFAVVASQSASAVSVALADGLQQSLIDHFQVAVPTCPRHEHPVVPKEIEGVAIWSCPQGNETWPVGAVRNLST